VPRNEGREINQGWLVEHLHGADVRLPAVASLDRASSSFIPGWSSHLSSLSWSAPSPSLVRAGSGISRNVGLLLLRRATFRILFVSRSWARSMTVWFEHLAETRPDARLGAARNDSGASGLLHARNSVVISNRSLPTLRVGPVVVRGTRLFRCVVALHLDRLRS